MRARWMAAFAAAGLLCGGHSALADGPRGWNGPYIGAHIGGAWGDTDIRTDAGVVTPTSYFVSPANIASVNDSGSGSASSSAFNGGAQLGFNVQQGNLVAGLEADFGAFNLHGSRGAANVVYPSLPTNTYTVGASMSTDWLFTARARLGWVLQPNLLVYATGGLALTNLSVSNSFSDDSDTDGVGGGSQSRTVTGWTIGGGTEWALSRAWSIKAEYLYVDFGSVTTRNGIDCGPAATFPCASVPVTPNAFSTSADLSAHIVRLGLNYQF